MVKDHGSIWDLPGWKMEKNEPNADVRENRWGGPFYLYPSIV